MTSFFPVSVLVLNFDDIEAKIETDLGLGLGKILQSRSWSWTSQSRLQLVSTINIVVNFVKRKLFFDAKRIWQIIQCLTWVICF